MDNNKVKAIKNTAIFNVPFSGTMYSRVIDLFVFVTSIENQEELDKGLKRIMDNDPTLTPEDHAYHLQTLMVFLKIIEKAATDANHVEEMTQEELQKQQQERKAPNL
jgi:hypothetical protein